MAEGSEVTNAKNPKSIERAPVSVQIAAKGIQSSKSFAALMGAIMTDVLCGSLAPDVANAACNAGGKLLKIVEMQHRYGAGPKENRVLTLIESVEDTVDEPPVQA